MTVTELPSWTSVWWKPIMSAPRDGTNFLAIMGNGTISVARYVGTNAFAADHLGSGNTDPTHWMPMPPKPD